MIRPPQANHVSSYIGTATIEFGHGIIACIDNV